MQTGVYDENVFGIKNFGVKYPIQLTWIKMSNPSVYTVSASINNSMSDDNKNLINFLICWYI